MVEVGATNCKKDPACQSYSDACRVSCKISQSKLDCQETGACPITLAQGAFVKQAVVCTFVNECVHPRSIFDTDTCTLCWQPCEWYIHLMCAKHCMMISSIIQDCSMVSMLISREINAYMDLNKFHRNIFGEHNCSTLCWHIARLPGYVIYHKIPGFFSRTISAPAPSSCGSHMSVKLENFHWAMPSNDGPIYWSTSAAAEATLLTAG